MGKLSTNATGISLIYISSICFILLFSVTIGFNYISHLEKYNEYIHFIFIFYWIITLTIQILLNIYIQSNICKNVRANYGTIFLMTLMPWIIVLGVFMILLLFMPGLRRVFSNTLGMSWMYMWYASNIQPSAPLDGNQPEINNQVYQLISKTPATIINEIEYTFNTYNEVYSSYSKQFPYLFTPTNKPEIKKLIICKDIIGYAIWVALITTITSVISINNTLHTECIN